MARRFTSAADRFQGSIGQHSNTSLTVGGWFLPTGDGILSGQTSSSIFRQGSKASGTAIALMLLTNNRIQWYLDRATTDLEFTTNNNAFASDTWTCVVASWASATNVGSLFVGTPDTPMAVPSLAASINGSGNIRDLGGDYAIGNVIDGGTNGGMDGDLSRVFFVNGYDANVDAAERFRLGSLDFIMQGWSTRSLLWMLDETDPSLPAVDIGPEREDLTPFDSPGVAEDPPIEVTWFSQAALPV